MNGASQKLKLLKNRLGATLTRNSLSLLSMGSFAENHVLERKYLLDGNTGLGHEHCDCDMMCELDSANLLWSPYIIGQTIIFLPCDFYLSFLLLFFFPRLISAAVDWMSTILPHMVWP